MKKAIILFLSAILVLSSRLMGYAADKSEVTFYTTMGNFIVEMEDAHRPITAGNFIGLVNQKFYDGIIFHRVINNFVIQGGDPTGTGSGGPGYTIMDEVTAPNFNNQKTIAMAKTSAPNSAGSQFYINLKTNAHLNASYSVFGTVINNFEVVQAIGAVPVNSSNRPLVDVVMDSVRVTYAAVGISEELLKPQKDRLLQNYPNPFNPTTTINYELRAANNVRLSVYNAKGELVKSLINGLQSAGKHSANFDGSTLNSGVYFYKLEAEGVSLVNKMILCK